MASAVAIAMLLAGLPRATAQTENEVAVAQVNAKVSPYLDVMEFRCVALAAARHPGYSPDSSAGARHPKRTR
jgi:hypothetical protein